jgi:hypothetical protein
MGRRRGHLGGLLALVESPLGPSCGLNRVGAGVEYCRVTTGVCEQTNRIVRVEEAAQRPYVRLKSVTNDRSVGVTYFIERY